jgi:hypothetical protein
MQSEKASILTSEQETQIMNLKQAFPFRICWCAVKAETNEYEQYASYTRRRLNSYIRKGWLVFEAKA